MTSKTHNVVAFACLLSATLYYPPHALNFLTLFSSVVGNIIGALSPDLDQASNRLWDLLPGGDYMGRIFRPFFLGHRSLSHSLLGTFIYFQILVWVLPRILNPAYLDVKIVLVSMMIGYISHLLSDSITEEGLPLFFPLQWKFGFPPIREWRMKTGKWFENLVVFPGVVVYVLWLVVTYRENLVAVLRLVQS